MKDHPTEIKLPLIERGPGGGLIAVVDGKKIAVNARLCFPWTERARFISLRDEENAEIALIDDLAALPAESRRAVERAMTEIGFVLEIQSIESVEQDFDLRNWKVTTRQGPRTFQTKLDDWPRRLPDGGFLIRDITGDLYHIARPDAFDPRSRKILWTYMD